jgi:hypothetical protein
MRERVDTTFLDQTNTLSYKIIRSVRADENSEWEDDSVMVVSRVQHSLVLTKANTKYVKLVFPVKEGATWIGDAYNNHVINGDEKNHFNSKESYTYKDAGKPFTIAGTTYDLSVTVVQGEPAKEANRLDDRKEVYVRNIGRVYRLFNRIVYCNDMGNDICPYGVGYKLDGHERQEILIAYGNSK